MLGGSEGRATVGCPAYASEATDSTGPTEQERQSFNSESFHHEWNESGR